MSYYGVKNGDTIRVSFLATVDHVFGERDARLCFTPKDDPFASLNHCKFASSTARKAELTVEKIGPKLPTAPGSVIRHCGVSNYVLLPDGWHSAEEVKGEATYTEDNFSDVEILFDAGEVKW